MKQWDEQLDKIKQTAIDIMKEDSNVVEVKVKKDEISIKRKPENAGDEKPKEIDENLKDAASKLPDSCLLETPKLSAAENPAQ